MLLSRYHLLSMWVYCLLCDPLETAFRGAVYCRAQDTLLVFYVGELVLLYPQEWTDLDTLAYGVVPDTESPKHTRLIETNKCIRPFRCHVMPPQGQGGGGGRGYAPQGGEINLIVASRIKFISPMLTFRVSPTPI